MISKPLVEDKEKTIETMKDAATQFCKTMSMFMENSQAVLHIQLYKLPFSIVHVSYVTLHECILEELDQCWCTTTLDVNSLYWVHEASVSYTNSLTVGFLSQNNKHPANNTNANYMIWCRPDCFSASVRHHIQMECWSTNKALTFRVSVIVS